MSKVLKEGARGDDVTVLQKSMVQLGYELEVDGIFGSATKEAVLDLQKAFGYDVDGIVGDGTRHCVDKRLKEGWNVQGPKAGEAAAKGEVGKMIDKGAPAKTPEGKGKEAPAK